MELLHKTQFAQFEQDFSKLPLFLQKKFEEAVVANSKKSDADRVTAKLEKAEKKLNEQKQQQEMKRQQKRLNYDENLERGRQAKKTKNEYFTQVQTHKQKVADEVYAEQLSIKINKAQTLGSKKVEEARAAREQSNEREQQRLRSAKTIMAYPNLRVESAREEKTNKLVYKHYAILKNVHTRKFTSQRQTLLKKENLETKLAKAEQRKQEILNEKIAKAVKAANKKDYGIVKETLEEKLLRKQNKAEENRKLIIQSKIDKAISSARLSTQSNSETSCSRPGNSDEHLKIAQSELKGCYSIIMAQKEANYKLLEEMTEMKKQMEDMKNQKPSTLKQTQTENQRKQNSYETKKPIAFIIGETTLSKKFCNFNPVNDEEKSWEMI